MLPLPAQVLALLLVADFTQYWVHRAFHRSQWLWRFHAIHHSIEQMDWLAGSRLHLVDVIATRGLTYVPIFVLGFSEPALMVYVFLVAIQATFIHANVRWTFRGWQRIVATPAFHHWHHSAEPQRSTRTSRCTRRRGICCSAPSTCRRVGRRRTAWRTDGRSRLAGPVNCSTRCAARAVSRRAVPNVPRVGFQRRFVEFAA